MNAINRHRAGNSRNTIVRFVIEAVFIPFTFSAFVGAVKSFWLHFLEGFFGVRSFRNKVVSLHNKVDLPKNIFRFAAY